MAKADIFKNLHCQEKKSTTTWKHIWTSTNADKQYKKEKGVEGGHM